MAIRTHLGPDPEPADPAKAPLSADCSPATLHLPALTGPDFLRLLHVANSARLLPELARDICRFVQEQTGFEAVGIRLREGLDYPYYETRGFGEEFLRAENRLCVLDAEGQPCYDTVGDPVLSCMCGNILRGRYDPTKPFFTANGSFWTNSTTRLLATTTAADRLANTRNRCNAAGYESVALIPLQCGEEVVGLMQLNDRRPGRLTAQGMVVLEQMAANVAAAIAHLLAEDRLRTALAEKDVLLREIHHRVKNNLQIIVSLLALQYDSTSNAHARAALQESRDRVQVMARLHEHLYRTHDVAYVQFSPYLRSLLVQLQQSYCSHGIHTRFEADDCTFGADTAIPCGLIVNDLVSNAYKHAFPARKHGEVIVTLRERGADFLLTVRDDGIGLPPHVDFENPRTLGVRLVTMLVRQLHATLRVTRSPGAAFEILFAAPTPEGPLP